MTNQEIIALINKMSLKEKVAQCVLVNEPLLKASAVMSTGPIKDLGFNEDFDFSLIGAVFNVNDPQTIKALQEEHLRNDPNKIPLLFMSDVIYGYKTILPIPLAQACSMDFELIKKCAATSAKEAYSAGLHILYSPMLDIVRDARWGRVMESFGEDVYVGEQYAKSLVEGYQGCSNKLEKYHVGACIKHFAGYGASVGGKDYQGVDMSEITFRQTHLPPYYAAIKANCKGVMNAFNTLNKVPCHCNRELNKALLKDELGYDGVIISDFNALEELITQGVASDKKEAALLAFKAHVDFDMMSSVYANHLAELVNEKKLSEAELDATLYRILSLKNALGLFENPYRGIDEAAVFLSDEAQENAKQLAQASIVLLENEQQILPLKPQQKVCVIGAFAASKLVLGFWAMVCGNPLDTISLVDALKHKKTTFTYSKGYNMFDSLEVMGNYGMMLSRIEPMEDEARLFSEALNNANDQDIIIFTFGENFLESGEGASKAHLDINPKQLALLKALKTLNKPIIGVLYTGRPLILKEAKKYCDAIVLAWYPGTVGNLALADILYGQSPSGVLSMCFPRHEGQLPIYYAQEGTGRPLLESNQKERFISKYCDEENSPLYDFGYGLSYTSIVLETEIKELEISDKASIPLTIKNTGNINSDVVIQVYISAKKSRYVRAIKALILTKKVYIEAQNHVEIKLELQASDFGYYDLASNKVIEPGEYQLSITEGSRKNNIVIKTIIKGEQQ